LGRRPANASAEAEKKFTAAETLRPCHGSNAAFYRAARGQPLLPLQSVRRLDAALDVRLHRMPSFRSVRAVALAALLVLVALAKAAAEPTGPVVLVVGDSISAAYGLAPGAGWVDLLSARLAAERYPNRVVNASITGDTTAGGRARLPTLLARYKPAIVVLELGGNDGLRGGDLNATRDNLAAMVDEVQHAGAKPLIVGMKLPPNYGGAYVRKFDALYEDVAKAHKAPFVPFFFEGFGEKSELFQPDGIHPTAAAQPLLLDNVWPQLRPLLGKPR
jgi:acyl-CoA thioesterase-1